MARTRKRKKDDGLTRAAADKIRRLARETYSIEYEENDLAIDDDAPISAVADGAWVQAWIWVPKPDPDPWEGIEGDL